MKKSFVAVIIWVVFCSIYFLRINFMEGQPLFVSFPVKLIVLWVIALSILAVGQIAKYLFCALSGIGNGSICVFPIILPSVVHRKFGVIIHNEALYRYTISPQMALTLVEADQQKKVAALELFRKAVTAQFAAKEISILLVLALAIVRRDIFLCGLCVYSMYTIWVLSQAKGTTYVGELALRSEMKTIDSEFCNAFFLEQIALYFLEDNKYVEHFESRARAADVRSGYLANSLFYYYLTLNAQRKTSDESMDSFMKECIDAWMDGILPASPQWYCICMYILYCIEHDLEDPLRHITMKASKEIIRLTDDYPIEKIRNLQIDTIDRLRLVIREKRVPEKYKKGFWFKNYYCYISDNYKEVYRNFYVELMI